MHARSRLNSLVCGYFTFHGSRVRNTVAFPGSAPYPAYCTLRCLMTRFIRIQCMTTPEHLSQDLAQSACVPRRVFISGALGFVGQVLAARYRQLGSEVRGVDKVSNIEQDVVEGNTALAGAWQAYAQDCDLFIHTAAIVSFTHDPRNIWEVNVLGTRHALDAAVRGG